MSTTSIFETAPIVHPVSIPDHGVLKQITTRYIHLRQFVTEAGKGSNLMGIDLLQVGQILLVSIVVLQTMMVFVDATISPFVQVDFNSIHHGNNPSGISSHREDHNVIHSMNPVGTGFGFKFESIVRDHRLVLLRPGIVALQLLFNLSHRVLIIGNALPVLVSKVLLEGFHLTQHGIKNAGAGRVPGLSRAWKRAAAARASRVAMPAQALKDGEEAAEEIFQQDESVRSLDSRKNRRV